jgi:dipeptidyl aminopeptidase/acylaminoacyl peptidase
LLLAAAVAALVGAANQREQRTVLLERPIGAGSIAVGTDQIWLVNPATRGVRALTPPGAHDSYPVYSPDGSQIAYVNHLGRDPVRAVNADGTGTRVITPGFGTSRPVTWSRDGRRLAFVADPYRGGGRFELHVVNADGTGLRSLATGLKEIRRIAWSPDGRAIAFVAYIGANSGGNGRVHVVDPDSGQVTRVSDSPVVDEDNGPLSWTPASEIVYAVQRTAMAATPGIVLAARADGGWTERLLIARPNGSHDLSLTTVGDGGRFVFIDAAGGREPARAGRLTIVNRDGSGLRELARDLVFAMPALCVAPDGSAVAASSAGSSPEVPGGKDIIIIPVDQGRQSIRVPVDQVPAYGPACSWQAVKP